MVMSIITGMLQQLMYQLKKFMPYAISIVILGGTVAGVFGPQISKWTQFSIQGHEYAATYFCYAGIEFAHFLLLFTVKLSPHKNNQVQEESDARPLCSVIWTSGFLLAAISNAFINLTMVSVMSMTDIYVTDHISFDSAATILQIHFLAMFLPSLWTGKVIAKFGTSSVISLGIVLGLAGHLIYFPKTEIYFYVGVILIGLGWNYGFIGSTTLLSSTYTPGEKFKVQSANDFFVFGLGAIMTLSTGPLLATIGSNYVSFILISFLLVVYIVWITYGSIYFCRHCKPEKIKLVNYDIDTSVDYFNSQEYK